jgi:hypothetical protein
MTSERPEAPASDGSSRLLLIAAWVGVGIPMLWGVLMTVKKASLLFR